MMKIQLLRNPSIGILCDRTNGPIGDIDDVIGEPLVRAGIAKLIETPEPTQGKPDEPSTSSVIPGRWESDVGN